MPRTFSLSIEKRTRQLAAISTMVLTCGLTQADVIARRAPTYDEYLSTQGAEFLVGVMGACVITYPLTRTDAFKAMRSMATTKVEDDELDDIVRKVGQCMTKEGVPTEDQCMDIAVRLHSGLDLNDKKYLPIFAASVKMLKPC
jgi:hypothetical protein